MRRKRNRRTRTGVVCLELLEEADAQLFGQLDRLQANARRIEGNADHWLTLGVERERELRLGQLGVAQLLEVGGDFVDEWSRELLLVDVDGRVAEEDALYLRYGQLGAHLADALDVRVGLARLQQVARLHDRLEGLESARLLQAAVAYPLLQAADVILELEAFGPAAQLLAKYEIVERVRGDEVEELTENLIDKFRIDAV